MVDSRGCRAQPPEHLARGHGGDRRERGGGHGGGGRRARTRLLGLLRHRGRRGGENRGRGLRVGGRRDPRANVRVRIVFLGTRGRRAAGAVRRGLHRASAERGRGAPRLLRRRDGRAGVRFRPPSHRDRRCAAVGRRARVVARASGHFFLPPATFSETTKRSSVRAQTVGIARPGVVENRTSP